MTLNFELVITCVVQRRMLVNVISLLIYWNKKQINKQKRKKDPMKHYETNTSHDVCTNQTEHSPIIQNVKIKFKYFTCKAFTHN